MEISKNIFLKNLYAFGRRQRFYKAAGGFIFFALLLFILWISVALADHLFYFSEVSRWGLLFINLSLLFFLAYKYILKPLSAIFRFHKNADLSREAQNLKYYYPQARDGFVNTYQLIRNVHERGVSSELREAAVNDFLEKYGRDHYKKRLRFVEYLPPLKYLVSGLLGGLLILAFRFNEIEHSTLRLLNPGNEYLMLPAYTFLVEPGNAKILKGDSLAFRVRYRGPALQTCVLEFGQPSDPATLATLTMKKKGAEYAYLMKDVRRSFSYRLKGVPENNLALRDHIYSTTYKITTLTPPLVEDLDITLLPPGYTGKGPQSLQRNVGDFSTLPGTKVKIKLSSTKPLRSARIVFSQAEPLPLQASALRVSGEFSVHKAQKYKIILQDTSGLVNRAPIQYQINLHEDEAPYVEIVKPGEDLEGRLDAQLALKIAAEDDYGLRSLNLHYQIKAAASETERDTSWKRLPVALWKGRKRSMEQDYILDFNRLALAFGDELRYYVSAEDNNDISGPGRGMSRIYTVTFPTLEEVFNNFDRSHEEQTDKIEETARQAKELKETLEKIDREMRRAKKMDWEKKQQLEKSVKKQQEMQKKIEQIRRELDKALQKLDEKQLVSPQVLEKYAKLQDLMQELMTPELSKALSKLEKALDKMDAAEVRKALKDFRLQQEVFEKNIDRAMELLKQVRFEQKMDELVQKAKNLLKQQEKIKRTLQKDSLGKEDFGPLQKQQQEQQSALDNFRKDFEKFRNETRLNKYPQTKASLDSTAQAMQNSGLERNMQQMKQQLGQQKQSAAEMTSQKLSRQFSQLKNALSKAQQGMLQQSKQQVMQKMARAAGQMLQLSFRQEELQRRTKKSSPLSDEFAAINREQGEILNDFNKVISEIVQLSKETFALNPQISKSLRGARQNMLQSLQALSERGKNSALGRQGRAMGALNKGVMQLKQSMSGLAQSKSGTGFEQLMKQLQQMAAGQGMINDQSMNIFQGQGNQGSMAVREQQALRRLAARQAALQKAMQQLSEEAGRQQNIPGDLGGIARQMDEVVRDLLKQNLNRQTIKRQRQILSRMLDAQKSLEQREYSEKRRAVQAQKYRLIKPRPAGETMDVNKKIIAEALRRAQKAGYKKEYRQLIEAYFKKLLKEEY